MVLKRLKFGQVFNGVARICSYTQAWVSKGGRSLRSLAKKAVFLVLSCKT